MKKILSLALALMMVLSLAACGAKTDPASSGSGTTDPGTQQTDPGASEPEQGGNTPAVSTDYFYDQYDFCEEWMMPDDGVYTGCTYISPDSNQVGNEAVYFQMYEMTDEQIAAYISKIEGQGYENLIGDSYSKNTGSATAMIQIDDYREDDGYVQITIDPSI